MAEAIEKGTGIKPDLVKSSGGVFEITTGGQLIFSKKATGRFPSDEEVLTALGRIKK
jgi:selenoprotein W-related protein